MTCMLDRSSSQASAAVPVQQCAEIMDRHFFNPIFNLAKAIVSNVSRRRIRNYLFVVCYLFVAFYLFMTFLWRNRWTHCVQRNLELGIFVCCLFGMDSGQRSQEIMAE